MKVAILLLAAGRGSRFGGGTPKAYVELGGAPLLLHCMRRLARCHDAGATDWRVLVHPDDEAPHLTRWLPAIRQAAAGARSLAFPAGGSSRQQSVQNGLATCPPDVDLVLVHDAARALVPLEPTRLCLAAALRSGAALLATPVADTLKRAVDGRIVQTVDRRDLWAAQTPQVVRRELLARAMQHALTSGFEGTDDVSLVEHLGEPVVVVTGSASNLKITRPEDLTIARALLAAETG